MVNSWEMDYVIEGTVRLNCGTATTAGYNHILDGHADDWQFWMEDLGLYGANWDDFMEWTVGAVLMAPGDYASEGNGKLCFTAPIGIVNPNDGLTWWFDPSIIVSENNRVVITAYPGSPC
ncbi:hypothetical protein OERS_05130 [Oerskovia enterophila]|uniref:Uncharacterized protein n=2 Tax=Oerskovia enterophila TaxID=43678 RepID=A0ABX2YD76_9CELL|nr:hypothetical protein OERS_05130 [Oerskovia enterophila]